MNIQDYKHIYFIGIGGVSMNGLAILLNSQDHTVSGSDITKSDVTNHLTQLGIKVNYSQVAANITDEIDLVVYTAAIHGDNPEFAQATALNIPMIDRATLLGTIMKDYKCPISIAGTHGKTTTTAILSSILINAQVDPTITVGGYLPLIDGTFRIGAKDYFLVESCEYNNSFLKFNPTSAIILNMEHDHPDFFADLDAVTDSFTQFANNLPQDGFLIINKHIPNFKKVIKKCKAKVVTISTTDKTADYYVTDFTPTSEVTTFTINHNNEQFLISTILKGEHNAMNILSAFALCHNLGFAPDVITDGIQKFTGVDRRLQHKGTIVSKNVEVYDDYAHHPTEIRTTLATIKTIAKNQTWCVFQPHTYTRTYGLFDDFANSFYDVDFVILLDIFPAREVDTGIVNSKQLCDQLLKNGVYAIYMSDFNECVQYLQDNIAVNDFVLTMGAGLAYTVGEKLLEREK